MKARHFALVRKRLTDKDWVEGKLDELAEEYKEWEHFYTFKCSHFFQGEKLAVRNEAKYYKAVNKINRQYEFLTNISSKL